MSELQVQADPRGQLTAAFELFNQMSDSLGASYRELETRVAELSQQLTEERSEKFRELAAKEQLADRLSTLLSMLPGGVVVLDPEGNIIEANPQAFALLGEDLLDKKWQRVLEQSVARIATGRSDFCLRNGRYISLSESVLDTEGYRIILVTDSTESHRLQEMASRETRLSALGEMSARLAHQLRTPLSSALLYASHLAKQKVSDDDRRRLGGRITDSLKHLDELIQGMLAFVRGEHAACQKFSLQMFMEDLRTHAAGIDPAKHVSLNLYCPVDAEITGDRDGLLSALTNIVENAVNLSAEPEVSLSASLAGAEVSILIEDNGPGVDEQLVARIFDPFFTTRLDGTGLGLAIADIKAREHGGSVEVSNREAGGACFTFRFQREPLEELELSQVEGSAE